MTINPISPWHPDTECPHPAYPGFKEALGMAAYHFADDSGKEWEWGRAKVREAAAIAIDARLPVWAIRRMVADSKCGLVPPDDVINEMLRILYQRG